MAAPKPSKPDKSQIVAQSVAKYLHQQAQQGTPYVIIDGEVQRYNPVTSRYEVLVADKTLSGREQHHNSLRRQLLRDFGYQHPYRLYDELAAEISLKAPSIDNEVRHLQLQVDTNPPRPLPYAIIFPNGCLHVDRLLTGATDALQPNGPHIYSQLPPREYTYDPAAQCPTWLNFLDQSIDAESAKCLGEWFGLVNVGCARFQKVLALVGPGGTGKSTVQNVLMALLGENACSNVGLARLGSQFGQKELLGKLLNISVDVKWVQDVSEDVVKAISGQDRISIDRKHRDPISVRIPARLMLVGNGDPRFHDSSGAILRRLLVVHFDNVVQQPDNELLPKLLAELPGIFNWAMEGLGRLFTQNAFTVSPAMLATQQELRTQFNPILEFVEDVLDINPKGAELCNVIYAHYQTWAEQNGIKKPLNNANFGRELRGVIPTLKREKESSEQRRYYYTGISLRRMQYVNPGSLLKVSVTEVDEKPRVYGQVSTPPPAPSPSAEPPPTSSLPIPAPELPKPTWQSDLNTRAEEADHFGLNDEDLLRFAAGTLEDSGPSMVEQEVVEQTNRLAEKFGGKVVPAQTVVETQEPEEVDPEVQELMTRFQYLFNKPEETN